MFFTSKALPVDVVCLDLEDAVALNRKVVKILPLPELWNHPPVQRLAFCRRHGELLFKFWEQKKKQARL